jgi:uracil phosphoribosyltransferase
LVQLATGGSAITAIEVLKEAGVAEENILFLNVVSCPEGLRALAEKTPGTLQFRLSSERNSKIVAYGS